MDIVTISPKYQVVIPKSVRERLRLKPGQLVQAIASGDRIELLPVKDVRDLRGVLRGMDYGEVREETDRL